MLEYLTRYWWIPLLQGLLGIGFGVVAFLQPGMTLAALVIYFGAWVLVDGVFASVGAIANRRYSSDWPFALVLGLLGIAVGILTLRSPAATELALLIYIAAWALLKGAMEIAMAIKLRNEIEGEWWLALAGAASVAFALLLLWNPAPGALALLWLLASYAIAFGVLFVVLGLRVRSFRRQMEMPRGVMGPRK